MTRSLTLAGQPHAGAVSKPHHYKQKVQQTKDVPKTWVLTGKQFDEFRRKKDTSSLNQTTPWNTQPLNTTIEYDQWHELQWQLDRWRTDLKKHKYVKIWSQHGTILVNSSFEHNYYHHQTPSLTTPGSNFDCGQPQGHHAGARSQRYQAPGNNYVTPPQLTISLHSGRWIFISGKSRNCFGITQKQTENTPMIWPKTCNVD